MKPPRFVVPADFARGSRSVGNGSGKVAQLEKTFAFSAQEPLRDTSKLKTMELGHKTD
jgi:hypothetical protein